MKMKSASWGAVAALGLFALAPVQTAFSAPDTQKTLTLGTTQEFESLNPLIVTTSASSMIYYTVGRPVVIVDHDWNYVCELCEKMPSMDNGLAKIIEEDGRKKLAAQWRLKKGLKWGDGTPLQAKDVKLGWEIARSPKVSVGEKEVFLRVERIELDDQDPLKFTTIFREPRYDFYQLISFYPIPSHIEGPIWEKTKNQTGTYEKQTKYTTNPTNPGLYSGPYVVSEIKLGSHVVVEKNKHFFGNEPKIDRLVFKLIPNTQTLEAALLSGTIDVISELGMTFDQAVSFEKRMAQDPANKGKYKVLFRDGLVYEHVDLNLDNPILKDKNVRKALVYAIDRDKLSQALFYNKQEPAHSNIHPLDPYYTEDVVKYEHSPEKAAALLDKAGWKMRNDGYRYKDGKKLELNIMTTAGNKTRELVEQFLQAQWKNVGINLTINNEPARVFFGETTRKRAFPAMAMFGWISSPDSPPRSTLDSSEIPTAENGWSGQNYTGWKNPKVDAILDKFYQEFDAGKRKKMMAEIQREYTSDVPVIPLYLRAQIAIIPSSLRNYELTGHLIHATSNVEDWIFTPKITNK